MFSEETKELPWTIEEDKKYKQNWADAPQFLNPFRSATEYNKRYNQLTNKKTGAWNAEEDKKLIKLIKIYGEGNWSDISNGLPNRTGKQCRDHFTNQLDPNINKDPWSEKEDKLLLDLYNEYHNQWKLIRMKMNRRSELQIKNRFKKLTNHLEEGPIKYYSTDEILNTMSKSSQLSPFISLSKNMLNQSNKNKNILSLKLSKNEEIRMESDDDDNNNNLFLNKIIKDEIKRYKYISKYELNPYSLRKGSLLYQKLEEHRLNRNNFIYYLNSNMLQSPPPPTSAKTSSNTNSTNLPSLPIPISHLHQSTSAITTNIEPINNNVNMSIPSPTTSSNTHPIYQIPLPPPPTLSEDMEECLENSFAALIPMQSTVLPQPSLEEEEQQQQPIVLQSISSSSSSQSPPSPPSSEDIQLQNNGIPFYVTYFPNNEMINQHIYNNNEYIIKLSQVDYPLINVVIKRDIKELENPFIKFDLPFSQRFPKYRKNDGGIDVNDVMRELDNKKISINKSVNDRFPGLKVNK